MKKENVTYLSLRQSVWVRVPKLGAFYETSYIRAFPTIKGIDGETRKVVNVNGIWDGESRFIDLRPDCGVALEVATVNIASIQHGTEDIGERK